MTGSSQRPGKYRQIFFRPVYDGCCCVSSCLACIFPCHALCCIGAIIYCFFPLFLPVDPETDAAAGYIYDPADQSFAAEQQGKQTPLDHSYIAYVFLPTACISILLLL